MVGWVGWLGLWRMKGWDGMGWILGGLGGCWWVGCILGAYWVVDCVDVGRILGGCQADGRISISCCLRWLEIGIGFGITYLPSDISGRKDDLTFSNGWD